MKLWRVLSFSFAVFAVSLLFGTLVNQAATAPNGAALYKQKCSMCHGVNGKGFAALKTPDFTSPKWQASIKDKAMEAAIEHGKKGTAMPAFAGKLNASQIKAVVAHIRSFKGKK